MSDAATTEESKPSTVLNEYQDKTARLTALSQFVTGSMYPLRSENPMIQEDCFDAFELELGEALKAALRAIKRLADDTNSL